MITLGTYSLIHSYSCSVTYISVLTPLRFNDESAPARAMYSDCSKSHNFKVRSASYLTDKTKVEAGPSISKLVLMELFEVEKHHGDRIDHIASKGAHLSYSVYSSHSHSFTQAS